MLDYVHSMSRPRNSQRMVFLRRSLPTYVSNMHGSHDKCACVQKQQAVLLAAAIDLGQPKADMVALWQAVAEEERREALFGHLSALYI